MARRVVRWATGVVVCRTGVGVHPYSFGDDVFRLGGHGY